jgi:hypothetical protein
MDTPGHEAGPNRGPPRDSLVFLRAGAAIVASTALATSGATAFGPLRGGELMIKGYRLGIALGVLMISACMAEDAPLAEEGEASATSEALVARRNPCDLVRCKDGFSCAVSAGKAICRPNECDDDSDCRLEADYCGGCNCTALAADEKLPVCKGEPVACFVSPCLHKSAECLAGQCVVSGGF